MLVVAIALVPEPATGQGLPRLVANRTSLGFRFDGSRTGSKFNSTSRQSNTEEWLVLPFAGSVMHPGILRYNFEIRPRFKQSESTGLSTGLNSRTLGFASNVTLMGAKPVRLDLHLDRSSGRTSGGFGTGGDFRSKGVGAGLSFANRLFPFTARISTRSGDSRTNVGPSLVPTERSERTFRGQMGVHNRKLDATIDWTNTEDRLRSSSLESRNASVNHRFRWGKGSELRSTWRRSDRYGSVSRKTSNWSEQVRIQHTSSSQTTLTYSKNVSVGTSSRASSQLLGWRFSTRPIPGLSVGGRASANTSNFAGGRQRNVSAGTNGSFRTSLPADTRVFGGAFLGYVLRDIEGSTGGFVPVLREEHEIIPTRAIRLNQSFSDPLSIEVRNQDETFRYEQDLDYEVLPLGGVTEIHIPPGSRILVGDVIAVTYRFAVQFDSQEEGFISRFNIGVSRRGVRLQHTRSERATQFSGTGVPVSGDFSQHSTSLSTNIGLPFGRLRADILERYRRSSDVAYNFREGSASFLFPVWNGLQPSIDVSGSRVRDRDDATTRVSLGITTRWAVSRTLNLRSTVAAVRWNRENGFRERSMVASGGVTWRVGRLEARAQYQYSNRDNSIANFTSGRLTMDIVRRF